MKKNNINIPEVSNEYTINIEFDKNIKPNSNTGGYKLTKQPKEYKVGDILKVYLDIIKIAVNKI